MRRYRKADFPLAEVRRYLEPGPIVLVSSAWRGRTNIMTLGWHMMMSFTPALWGCYIWDENYSFDLIRRSRECVVNLPTLELVNVAVDIGNCSGAQVDKFERFGLTPVAARKVGAPLIAECHSSFECRLADASQIRRHGLFIWEVVKAHVARAPARPKTLHYRGDGEFMVAGRAISRRSRFAPEHL